MPDLTRSTAVASADGRDRFRGAVAALPPGPLRDVLTAVAYGRDAAARVGSAALPDDRWTALVAVAERAVLQASVPTALSELPAGSEVSTVPGTHGRARRRSGGRRRTSTVAAGG
jgi:hypothetical protein